jgi:acyl carrier protein phosphodiesterase
LNYLAHAFLSPPHNEIFIGNMLGDFVKPNQKSNYSASMREGFTLHQKIDQYTDAHDLVKASVAIFKPQFLLSGGIFVDILFDHFLANDERYFTGESLKSFCESVYDRIHAHKHVMNDRMKFFFGHMIEGDWLYSYKFKEGLYKSLRGICKRYPKLGDPEIAITYILKNEEVLLSKYYEYFPLLQSEVKT